MEIGYHKKFSKSAAYCSCATAYSSCAFLCHCFVFISLDALVVRVHFSSFIVKDGHILIGYEDAGDFTVAERLKTSVHIYLV
ncbi:hypothetical protein CsSME_00048157 [Camellia sinensis var. sinensis]